MMSKQIQSHSYRYLARMALAVPLIFCAPIALGSDSFDVSREFPNLFLRSDAGQSPNNAKISEARDLLEKALHSIFRRLQVPVSIEGQYKMVNYFEYVQSYVTRIDPKAEVMPSGGVVRSALGYIYSELYDASFEKPGFDPGSELKRISAAQNAIPIYEIRGVGSDFDLLVRGHTQASLSKIKLGVNQVTAGISSNFKVEVGKTDMTRTLFTIEDIKDYHSQTNRSVKQGGADIDFLSFSLAEGKIVEPSDRDGIVERFIKGQYAYLKPERPTLLEDSGKQTLRGIRALVELPFLSIEEDSQLRKEITELTRKVNEGDALSKKALGQIDKIVRNSRFSAGHNRFYRGANGSLEAAIEGLLIAINHRYNTAIPEFVDHIPFDIKPQVEVPYELLIPVEEFRSRHTNNGVIYHGTKEVAHALAILRGGLTVSGGKNRQGVAAYGRGGYSTANHSTAKTYAGSHGIVFTLGLKEDLPLKIIDWQKAKGSQFIADLKRKHPGQDVHEVLARNYGVDIILNTHILIQNTAAIEFPKSVIDIVSAVMDSLRSQIEAGAMPGQSALRTALTFSNYARALGVTDGLEFDHSKLLDLAKKSRNSGVILDAYELALEGGHKLTDSPLDLVILAATRRPSPLDVKHLKRAIELQKSTGLGEISESQNHSLRELAMKQLEAYLAKPIGNLPEDYQGLIRELGVDPNELIGRANSSPNRFNSLGAIIDLYDMAIANDNLRQGSPMSLLVAAIKSDTTVGLQVLQRAVEIHNEKFSTSLSESDVTTIRSEVSNRVLDVITGKINSELESYSWLTKKFFGEDHRFSWPKSDWPMLLATFKATIDAAKYGRRQVGILESLANAPIEPGLKIYLTMKLFEQDQKSISTNLRFGRKPARPATVIFILDYLTSLGFYMDADRFMGTKIEHHSNEDSRLAERKIEREIEKVRQFVNDHPPTQGEIEELFKGMVEFRIYELTSVDSLTSLLRYARHTNIEHLVSIDQLVRAALERAAEADSNLKMRINAVKFAIEHDKLDLVSNEIWRRFGNGVQNLEMLRKHKDFVFDVYDHLPGSTKDWIWSRLIRTAQPGDSFERDFELHRLLVDHADKAPEKYRKVINTNLRAANATSYYLRFQFGTGLVETKRLFPVYLQQPVEEQQNRRRFFEDQIKDMPIASRVEFELKLGDHTSQSQLARELLYDADKLTRVKAVASLRLAEAAGRSKSIWPLHTTLGVAIQHPDLAKELDIEQRMASAKEKVNEGFVLSVANQFGLTTSEQISKLYQTTLPYHKDTGVFFALASDLSKAEQLKVIAEMHKTNVDASVDLIRRFPNGLYTSDIIDYLNRVGGTFHETLAYELLYDSSRSMKLFDLILKAEWPQDRRSQFVDAAFQRYVFWYDVSETAKSSSFRRRFYEPRFEKETAERLWQLRKSLTADDPAARRVRSYDATSDFLWTIVNRTSIGSGSLLTEVLETIEKEFGSERLASALSKANVFQVFKTDHRIIEKFRSVHGRVSVDPERLIGYLGDTRLSGEESVRLIYGLVQATGAGFTECCAESIKSWLKSEYSYYGYTKNHESVISYLTSSNRQDLITLGTHLAIAVAGNSPKNIKETWVRDLLAQTVVEVSKQSIEKILPAVWSAGMIDWAEEFVKNESGKTDILELVRTNLRQQPYKIARELMVNFYEVDGKVKSDRQFTDKMDRWSGSLYSWVANTVNGWRGLPPAEEVDVLKRAIALDRWTPELQAAVRKVVSDYPSLKGNKDLVTAMDSRVSSRSVEIKSVNLNEVRQSRPVPTMKPAISRCAEVLGAG